MKKIDAKRCVIGEGPIWNESEKILYFTNGFGKEMCMFNVCTGELKLRPLKVDVAAFAFTKDNRLIVSRYDGVFILNEDQTTETLYDTSKIEIKFANDMKVGPDGRIYVGTQSGKRAGVSDEVDGKLYSIDRNGNVRVLLKNLRLSNGLEWSMDEKYFFHADSDTHTIKKYTFDREAGEIEATGEFIELRGVDGFTVDCNNDILAACWGQGHIAVIDADEFRIKSYIEVPVSTPASCCFVGENLDVLAITTASYGIDTAVENNAGYTFLSTRGTKGRKPYLFG